MEGFFIVAVAIAAGLAGFVMGSIGRKPPPKVLIPDGMVRIQNILKTHDQNFAKVVKTFSAQAEVNEKIGERLDALEANAQLVTAICYSPERFKI